MEKQLVYKFNIAGQTRTLNFGMLAWSIFCETMDVPLGRSQECFARPRIVDGTPVVDAKGVVQYEESPSIARASMVFCYAAIVSNDRLNQVPDSITMGDIEAVYNDSPEIISEVASIAINIRLESTLDKIKAVEANKKIDDKKKASRSSKSRK